MKSYNNTPTSRDIWYTAEALMNNLKKYTDIGRVVTSELLYHYSRAIWYTAEALTNNLKQYTDIGRVVTSELVYH